MRMECAKHNNSPQTPTFSVLSLYVTFYDPFMVYCFVDQSKSAAANSGKTDCCADQSGRSVSIRVVINCVRCPPPLPPHHDGRRALLRIPPRCAVLRDPVPQRGADGGKSHDNGGRSASI
ncbi:hypothetical protein niasHT_014879 [Heterodera trifolii]|uniref:Uncharacterized protein n=1 Tax=Heterodera trifolii TaxID=157864 RepID=A0ABD2L6U9_9BILA